MASQKERSLPTISFQVFLLLVSGNVQLHMWNNGPLNSMVSPWQALEVWTPCTNSPMLVQCVGERQWCWFFQTWLGNLGPLISGSNLTILSSKVFTIDRKRVVGVFFWGGFGGHWRHFRDCVPKKFFWKDLYEGLCFSWKEVCWWWYPHHLVLVKSGGLWLVTLPIIGTQLSVYMTWCMPHSDIKTTYFLHQLNMFEPHHVYTIWKVYIDHERYT